jgi:hypothetical protein
VQQAAAKGMDLLGGTGSKQYFKQIAEIKWKLMIQIVE